jgi:hypothetical protein
MPIFGVMDKKNGFFDTFLPSGQKEWCLFLWFISNLRFSLHLYNIKQNGSRLCWRATCQG